MNGDHIGEDAELYAIGALDDADRARIDDHVAGCASCARRLGEAEETILGLEREHSTHGLRAGLRPISARIPSWWPAVAIAAALVLGFIVPHPQPAASPQLAMLHSHFSHAQFTGNGPLAKVLYGRDRSWYYIIVEGARSYTVAGDAAGRTIPLGRTRTRGSASELFVDHAQPYTRIELREGASVVETALIR